MGSLVFSKFSKGFRTPYEVMPDRAGFFLKNVFAPDMSKLCGNSQLWKDLVSKFFCIWYIMIWYMIQFGILYYLLYSRTNPIPVENVVPEIWPKMF